MSGNNETDRSSAVNQVGPPPDRCVQATPMSDTQAFPTRVAAKMRAEAAVVQGAADLIGSAERNGMGVAVLVMDRDGLVLHRLGAAPPDDTWLPQDPEQVALSALVSVARDYATGAHRIAAAQALLGHVASRPRPIDRLRELIKNQAVLASSGRGPGSLALIDRAEVLRNIEDCAPGLPPDARAPAASIQNPDAKPGSMDDWCNDLVGAVNGLFRLSGETKTLHKYTNGRVIVIGTPDQVREMVDDHEFGFDAGPLNALRIALPGLRFGIQRGDATWIALPDGSVIAYGKTEEIASMAGSEQQRVVAAAATAEVDAQAEVSIVADLQVTKAKPRPPSHTVRAENYTSPFPHAFRRNRDSALCWAWLSPSRLGGVLCMVEHLTGESVFVTSASALLTEYTQLTAG